MDPTKPRRKAATLADKSTLEKEGLKTPAALRAAIDEEKLDLMSVKEELDYLAHLKLEELLFDPKGLKPKEVADICLNLIRTFEGTTQNLNFTATRENDASIPKTYAEMQKKREEVRGRILKAAQSLTKGNRQKALELTAAMLEEAKPPPEGDN